MPVVIYSYRVNADDVARACRDLSPHLSAGEIQRVERFRHEPSKHTAMLGRLWLRRVLAQTLGCSVQALTIVVAPGGKPYMPDVELHFNVSHSGNEMLLAVGDQAVGVDIEQVRQRAALDDLAQHVMHAEEWQRYVQLSESARLDFFYRTWVLKEAFVKWRGDGIAGGLTRFETRIEPAAVISEHQTQTAFIDVPSGYRGAFVTGANCGLSSIQRVSSVFDRVLPLTP